jgi:beta-phosphoglucomutase-like phosphatase (HAD superfamily)
MHMNTISAFGFDLDDTIVIDSTPICHRPRWRFAVESCLTDISPKFTGLSDYAWNEIEINSFGVPEHLAKHKMIESCERLFGISPTPHGLASKAMEFIRLRQPTVRTWDDVRPLMEFAATRGIPIGVATSSSSEYAEWVLKQLNLRKFVKVIVGSDDAALDGAFKPGPKPWQVLWTKLNLPEDGRVYVFEDSADALAGALASRDTTFGVLLCPNPRREAANRILLPFGSPLRYAIADEFRSTVYRIEGIND